MKCYIFPYFVSFGKGDSMDNNVSVELTDEEAVRLENSAHEEPRWRLYEDKEIRDIFDKVYKSVVENEIQSIIEDDELIEELREEFEDSEEYEDDHEFLEEYIDNLDVGVNYPEELQMIE